MFKHTPNQTYEKVKAKNYPIDKIIEHLKMYFGEENKELIERLRDIVPVFILDGSVDMFVESQSRSVVDDAIKKMCEKNPTFLEIFPIDIIEMIVHSQLTALATEDTDNLIVETIAEYSQVITELGFNPKEIINEKGEYELVINNNSPETKRLKEYLKNIYFNQKNSIDMLEVEDIISAYNTRAETKDCSEIYFRNNSKNDKLTTSPLSISYSNLSNLGVDFPMINVNNLSEDNKKFLLKFMQGKNPFNESSEYVLKNINEIFNKNFKTREELFADETMTMFLTFRTMFSDRIAPHILNREVKTMGLMPANSLIDYSRRQKTMVDQFASGCFHQSDNTIDLLVSATVSVIIHELLHGLGSYNGDFNINDEAEGLNEIVNEYLTLQILRGVNQEEFENNKLFENKTNYETAIDALKPFLTKYENKLKECKLGNAQKTLKDFIGEKNYNILIDYTNLLSFTNYGKFNISIVYKGQRVSAFSEFLHIYERDSSIMELLGNNERNLIATYLKYNNFIKKLVEHYEEFEKGNIVDFPLDSELNRTEENSYTN